VRHDTSGQQLGPGVVGLAGRVPTSGHPAASRALKLAGRPLPLVGTARIYVCGITPYDVTHLGHAATFVWADALAAVISAAGITTLTCRNVTDVDDVLTRAAERGGQHYDEFALSQEFLFGRDMARLRVKRPDVEPRARHHIVAVQQLAEALLAAGAAYERDGYVYFRGRSAVEAAHPDLDDAWRLSKEYGDQPDDPTKDDPFDVPVWRPSDESDPAWPSRWGWGRPGWHAECAAMTLSVFGATVDVLAGGADLAFPHHVYQQAMAQAALTTETGPALLARREFHVGEVRLEGSKMAKSTGNLVLVDRLLGHHAPAAVRLLLLDRAWSESWEYEPTELDRAEARLERLYAAAGRPSGTGDRSDEVATALLADLDVPRALDLAEELGGSAARLALATLRLS
jgi:L-cysteine:1D-myo-inositol 2-amino-2-deoxy-alpha-D-glucopyranoside ligase